MFYPSFKTKSCVDDSFHYPNELWWGYLLAVICVYSLKTCGAWRTFMCITTAVVSYPILCSRVALHCFTSPSLTHDAVLFTTNSTLDANAVNISKSRSFHCRSLEFDFNTSNSTQYRAQVTLTSLKVQAFTLKNTTSGELGNGEQWARVCSLSHWCSSFYACGGNGGCLQASLAQRMPVRTRLCPLP